MGLIERIREDRRAATESRVIGGVPWRPWDNPYYKFNIGGPIHPSRSFYGQDRALGLPALYSCTRLLAESLASLPLKIYTSAPGSDITKRYTGPSIFDQPSANTDVSLYDWLYQMMTALLLHGNAWGMVTGRDGYGYPTGIDWIPPDWVQVEDDSQQPWNPYRTRVYVQGRLIPDWRTDLFHVKGYALPGRTEGLSPLRQFALTVMGGIESLKYGVDWFSAGGFPSGVFQNQELEVSLEDAREIRESLMEAIQGHKPLVIGRDWDYKPVAVPPSEAQFIEACTTGSARFAMADGTLRRADEVRAGDEVISWDDGMLVRGRVVAAWPVAPRPTVGVTTQCGRHLETSLDHPYWVSRRPRSPGKRYYGTLDGNARWMRADEIRAGDYVRVALGWEGEGDFDPESAWALGALTGDGHLPTTGMPTFTSKDPEIIARLGSWCREHGADLVRSDPMRPVSYRVNTGPGSRYNPPQLRRELREWGILGRNAEAKRVPGVVMGGGPKAWAAFLSGYLDTDGTVVSEDRPQPLVIWSSVSRELLDGCQHLLAMLGIGSAIRRHQAARCRTVAGRECEARETWTLTVCGRGNVRQLAGLLNLAHPGKAARLAAWGQAHVSGNGVRSDCRWTRVISVNDCGSQVTYGVTVEGTHTHVTEGLVTHNTQMNATQVAAVYGLPPDRVGGRRGDSLTYNTVEQSTLQVIEALRPWIVRLETAFFRLLPQNRFCRFNADALLKTDLKTRTEIYSAQRAMGMLTIDEIRDLEDKPPYPNSTGDEKIPLDVMIAMSRSIRGIPKSMLPSIELEVDIIAEELKKLEAAGLTKPNAGPSVPGPEDFLSSQVGSVRKGPNADAVALLPYVQEVLAETYGSAVAGHVVRQALRRAKREPEYLGPWIPKEGELAQLAAVNGNGNGKGGH